jgi:flotillin
VIRAKGEAEANAMQTKAGAYQEYNQAAVLDRLLAELPEVVRALAEPLTKVDKITVISTGPDGQGTGTGVNRVTADMASMIAQVPALLESLTGVRIEDLLKQVPATGASNGRGPTAATTRAPAPNDRAERVEAEPVDVEGQRTAAASRSDGQQPTGTD